MAARLSCVLPALRTFLVVLCVAAPAAGQRVALSEQAIDVDARAIVRGIAVWDLPSGREVARTRWFAAHDPVFTADGRFLLFDGVDGAGGSPPLVLLDLSTGGESVLPVAFVPHAAHPRAAAVLGTSSDAPARFDLAGLHVWTACGTDAVKAMDVSADGAIVAMACGTRVVVVDSGTGVPQHTVAVPALASDIRLTAPSEALVVSPVGVERYDLATGAVLATRAGVTGVGAAGPRATTLGWFCVTTPPPRSVRSCGVSLIDSQTLADLPGIVDRAYDGRYVDHAIATDDRRAVVTRGTVIVSTAELFDAATGVVVASASRGLGRYTLALASLPSAPIVLAPTIAGGAVTLTWTLPDYAAAATGYQLEAGAAPGATSVLLDLGPGGSFTAASVPPGRYYVRVRAMNVTGVSLPSNEIVVDVP